MHWRSVLNKVTAGRINIITPERRYTFPPESIPACLEEGHAEIRVLNSTFWIRLALMSDLGFAEAFMFGEADCDDLPALFQVSLERRNAIRMLQ